MAEKTREMALRFGGGRGGSSVGKQERSLLESVVAVGDMTVVLRLDAR
jgi:hypothetical protein